MLGEQLQIFVRSPGGARFFTWEPPSGDTPIAALVESLRTEYPRSQHGPIDLIDESSGKLIDPDLSAQEMADRVLGIRTGYVSDALNQLEALRRQEGPAFGYRHEPGTSTISLDLSYPGLDRIDSLDGSGIVVKGRHRATLILPSDFPEKPPRIFWQSSVFHPNLAVDEEVWPPRYDWTDAPTLLEFVAALIETLTGDLYHVGRRFSIRRPRELNPQAANWYRRNRQPVAALAACARQDRHTPIDGYPLDSVSVDWELQGELSGSDTTVFVSRQAIDGIPEFGGRCAAWLIGQTGRHGQADWLYVDRVTSRVGHGLSGAPINAIGILRGPGESDPQLEHDRPLPLDARVRDGGVVLRVDSGDLAGYMVEVDGASSTEQAPQPPQASGRPITIKVPSAEQAEETIEAAEFGAPPEGAEDAGRLFARDLEAPICMYCDIVCVRSEDWGACADCGFVVHAGCLHQLGGCPNTDCPRSVLEPRSTANP